MSNVITKKHIIKETIKGSAYALILSIVIILIFAIIIKYTSLNTQTISIVNQIIKIISIILGCMLGIHNNCGIVKGIFIGGIYIVISYLTFSLLNGEFTLKLMDGVDLATSLATGGISGIIAVNIKVKLSKSST